MQENNLFSWYNNSNQNQKEKEKEQNKYKTLLTVAVLIGVVLYPFLFVGVIPLVIVMSLDKKDQAAHIDEMDYKSFLKRGGSFFMALAGGFAIVNIACFILLIPRGYFSCYLLFPLNLLDTALTFNYQTILALVIGGSGMGAALIAFSSFVAKRRVVSKEDERLKVTQSKDYEDRRKNSFQESQRFTEEEEAAYQEAKRKGDVEKLLDLRSRILLGASEFGKPYYLCTSELNKHVLIPGTSGSGKTTLIQLFVQHAAKFDIPLVLIDGKGARATLTEMETIANFYGRKVRVFTDTGHMKYNPIKHGNEVVIENKLVALAKTESEYYTSAAKLLLLGTVQLIDTFSEVAGFKRSLFAMQKYMMPRKVLDLFAKEIWKKKPDMFVVEVVAKTSNKKGRGPKKESIELSDDIEDTSSIAEPQKKEREGMDRQLRKRMESFEEQPETERIRLDPRTIDLDSYYQLVKRYSNFMTPQQLKVFERLFVRYEHKENPFYLYATSEALQTNINMLLDSELGRLFDPEGAEDELDIGEIAKNNEIVYISLNGLIYSEFIVVLAQMLVHDINYYASEMYIQGEEKPFFAIFDEPASYLNEAFIDTVNKTRGVGLCGIFTPQTMADIKKLGDQIDEQLVGNVNTLMVGKTNSPLEREYWSKSMGTYQDIELTSVVQQEAGYSDVGKSDWTGEKGTKRNVDRFIVHPNKIRKLKQGEYIVERKASSKEIPTQSVYIRSVSDWIKKQENEKKK